MVDKGGKEVRMWPWRSSNGRGSHLVEDLVRYSAAGATGLVLGFVPIGCMGNCAK